MSGKKVIPNYETFLNKERLLRETFAMLYRACPTICLWDLDNISQCKKETTSNRNVVSSENVKNPMDSKENKL